MKVINVDEFKENLEYYTQEIKNGKIFIHPTDTIYGIGCDATNPQAVLKIFEIKKRENKPFNIGVPSIDWIHEYCEMNHETEFSKLPGPYTFILKPKSHCPLALKEINATQGIGLRIPNAKVCELLRLTQIPFVSTSVNISGEPPSISLNSIPLEIQEQIDFAIDVGEINNPPSQVFDLRNDVIIRLR